jgi:hypothetical protein
MKAAARVIPAAAWPTSEPVSAFPPGFSTGAVSVIA